MSSSVHSMLSLQRLPACQIHPLPFHSESIRSMSNSRYSARFNLDSSLHYHYITSMIISFRRSLVIVSLLLAWVCSGGLPLVAYTITGIQLTFHGERNQDLNQLAIAELPHREKRDTVRRDHLVYNSISIHHSSLPLLAIHTLATPNGQCVNRADSRPLHQKISLYPI